MTFQPLQRVFGTGGIPAEGWLFVLPFAPALLLADEVRKAMTNLELIPVGSGAADYAARIRREIGM